MDKRKLKAGARNYLDELNNDGAEESINGNCSGPMELPSWYDEKLFKKAQQYYMDNVFAMFTGKLVGLIAVLSIPNILNILIHTNQSSIRMTAYKRYIQTIFHTQTWYENDLVPNSKSWKSLEAVRKMHLSASKRAEKGQIGFISQRDMALTQFGFMGYVTIRPEFLGIQLDREKHEAFIHFWRVIGHLVGIDERYNLCAETWDETKYRLELILNDIYKPLLEQTTKPFHDMASVLLEAMWCFNPFIAVDSFLYFTKYLTGCNGYLYYASAQKQLECKRNENERTIEVIDWYSRAVLCLQIVLHGLLLNFAYIRWYFNSQIHISTFLIKYFPFLAFFTIGIQNSYVRILKGSSYSK